MVSEDDFAAALQAYQDALANPNAQIENIRPHVEGHLDKLISNLPGFAQPIAKQRAYDELDKIETMAKHRAAELAEQAKQVEDEAMKKVSEISNQLSFDGAKVSVEPNNPIVNTPFTVHFSGNSQDKSAWIGI